jgi:hypothetical protein
MKASKADVYVFSRGTSLEPADFYVADASLANPSRLTDQRPQVAAFTWSTRRAARELHERQGGQAAGGALPARQLREGKSYPTVVNFYEKMSQTANQFANPSTNGFNRSRLHQRRLRRVRARHHLSRERSRDVGGVVHGAGRQGRDRHRHRRPKKIGITGHSWGGYQTAFLITQTDLFAAAVAGAPLTNMVSMYSLVYKNSGGSNGAIFESSQGRFKGGFWDNWDAYYRNSPVFFAKNVKTPLMILHNDKDGAVDFTQGVEYFNTLRRMQKPVIMLEYIGENHGLAKRPTSATTPSA